MTWLRVAEARVVTWGAGGRRPPKQKFRLPKLPKATLGENTTVRPVFDASSADICMLNVKTALHIPEPAKISEDFFFEFLIFTHQSQQKFVCTRFVDLLFGNFE